MVNHSWVELHRLQVAACVELQRIRFPYMLLERADCPASILHAALDCDNMIFAARQLAERLDEYSRGNALTEPAKIALDALRREALIEHTQRRAG